MKIIVIVGQTSTGKSDFAVEIAKQINAEIISADSRQVYKGMNLGTGKITKKEMKGVPHHLLNIVSPSRIFSVNDFQKEANKKIKTIIKKGKIPIICGGTGFYIDSITNVTIFPNVPPNKKLREKLSRKTKEQLFEMLKKIDAVRAENIDQNNPVRLIRAIEIAKALGKVPSLNNSRSYSSPRQGLGENCLGENVQVEVIKIGLTLPPEILKERIKTRLLARIKKGMIKEIENLHQAGLSWKRMFDLGLEYRYGALYLQKKISKTEMIEKILTETWHYAKRQKTWFKRDQNIIWIDPTKNKERNFVFKEVKKFLNSTQKI